MFLSSGIRQLIVSPDHHEYYDACQHHQEILRLGDSISQMGKGTGTGKQEIYLHREEPALYLLPSLANHSSHYTDSHTGCRPQMFQSKTLSQSLILIKSQHGLFLIKTRQCLHHPIRESIIRNLLHPVIGKESLKELIVCGAQRFKIHTISIIYHFIGHNHYALSNLQVSVFHERDAT